MNPKITAFLQSQLPSLDSEKALAFLAKNGFSNNGLIAIASLFAFAHENGKSVDAVLEVLEIECKRNWGYQHPEIRADPDAPGAAGVQNRASLDLTYAALGIKNPMGGPEKQRHIDLTPPGEQEYDWQKIADIKPEGYMELNDGKTVIHGPVKSVVIDEIDWVIITLRWAAIMPYIGQPGFGTWKNAPDHTVLRFPNFLIPYIIKETPEKGPRLIFGTNLIYLNKVDGIDPSKVEGLKLS